MSEKLNVLGSSAIPEQGIEALRERSAGALEQALEFVEAQGNSLSKIRAHILVELEPVASGLAWLAEHQSQDGSLPDVCEVFPGWLERDLCGWDSDGKISGTLAAMSVLGDWKQFHDATGDRAIEFLRDAQSSDGAFGESGGSETDSLMRVFATGMLSGFLGRTRSARPEIMQAAGRYLGGHWSVDFIRKQPWPGVAAFAHYFTNVIDDEAEAALPWCSRELERGKLAHEYSAGQVLRVLFYCEAEALPGVDFNTNGLLDHLLKEQLDDGSFGTSTDASGRIGETLDAMMFIMRLCRTGGQ